MKITLSLLFAVGLLGCVKGQQNLNLDDLFNRDCGHWEISKDTITGWTTEDTLGHKNLKTSKRHWVEDVWRSNYSNTVNAVYCPCGCPDPGISTQYRVLFYNRYSTIQAKDYLLQIYP